MGRTVVKSNHSRFVQFKLSLNSAATKLKPGLSSALVRGKISTGGEGPPSNKGCANFIILFSINDLQSIIEKNGLL